MSNEPKDQDADARDAARYRWLRDGRGYFPEEEHINGGTELDRAIDAEMARERADLEWQEADTRERASFATWWSTMDSSEGEMNKERAWALRAWLERAGRRMMPDEAGGRGRVTDDPEGFEVVSAPRPAEGSPEDRATRAHSATLRLALERIGMGILPGAPDLAAELRARVRFGEIVLSGLGVEVAAQRCAYLNNP